MSDAGGPEGQRDSVSQEAPEAARRQEKAADRRHTVIVAIASGVIGIVGALLGSFVQIYGAEQTNHLNVNEERAREDRERRAESYVDFITAAEKTSRALLLLQACVDAEPNPKLASGEVVLRDSCADQAVEYAPIWQSAVETATTVSIYGSQEAVNRATRLFATLPKAPVTDKGRGGFIPLDGYNRLFKFDFESFDSERASFLELACRELVNNPRAVCR